MMRWVLYGICAILLVNGVVTLVNALGWMRRTDVRSSPKIRNLMAFAFPGGVLLVAASVLGYVYDSWVLALIGLALAWFVKYLEARYAQRDFSNVGDPDR